MVYNYEALYAKTPAALGEVAPWVRVFFDAYKGKYLRILDIGCGQGRDGLYAAGKGHSLVGIDHAPSGIAALIRDGRNLAGDVTGHVADLRSFAPDAPYDVLLINRTLHMLAPQDRTLLLERLLAKLYRPGFVLIADEPRNMQQIGEVVKTSCPHINWTHQTKNSLIGEANG